MARRRHSLAARRKAVGLSQENLAHIVGVDRSTVVRWERADTEPQPWHRPKLAEALKVSVEELAQLLAEADEQLGFHMQQRRLSGASVTDVDRQQFFRLTGTVMALPWMDLLGPTKPTPVPARVGAIDIEQVRSAAKVFSSWDNAYGGGLARE